ncbi:MAG: M28 family metallopeptidase [Aestuariibacter sp.]
MIKQPLRIFGLALLCGFAAPSMSEENPNVIHYLHKMSNPENGMGAREAGSENEQKAASLILSELKSLGYTVSEQKFKHPVLQKKDEFVHSSNIIADKKGQSDKVLVLGAHFDSTGSNKGSLGAMDNGSGSAVLLAVARQISKMDDLPYSVRFVAFGAEEIGLVGSRKYMEMLKGEQPEELARIVGMVNLDTVAGGDYLYVHSAHTTAYKCGGDNSQFSSEITMREALLAASTAKLGDDAHKIHPEFPGYPEGVTGDWSDHEPFACNGVPIAYIETTNFQINGKDGYDGYSQSTDPALWDCYDAEKMTACDRDKESLWGRIWHEKHDRLDYLLEYMPKRIHSQLENNVTVLVEFFSNPTDYLK